MHTMNSAFWSHRTTESLQLEKTFKIIKSNHQRDLTSPTTNARPSVPHPCTFLKYPPHATPRRRGTHYVAVGRLPQQPPKGDDGGHAGTVEEEEGRQTLQAQSIPKVTPEPRDFSLHIQDQTSKEPGGMKRNRLLSWQTTVNFLCCRRAIMSTE